MAIKRPVRISQKYMQSYNALYGNGKISTNSLPISKKSVVKEMVPTEKMDQIRLVNWMADNGIKCYAVPNGRKDSAEGARYKRLGASAGVPDICIPLARKSYHGLYIELKRIIGGVVSESQKEWIDFLNKEGYKACVARGFSHAKQIIEDYLGWK